jgi:hypothetical protein
MNKQNLLLTSLSLLLLSGFSSCKKWAEDKQDIYKYVAPPAQPISDAAPLCGSIKGTMLANKTYTIGCDVYVNAGDTLTIQPGAKVIFTNSSGMLVKGAFFSLGTKDNPIYLGVTGQTKTDAPQINFSPSKDSAFLGKWKGILGDVTSTAMVFKWTKLEYCGALLGSNNSTFFTTLGLASTDPSYAVYFSNTNGYFVFEDSWIYGTVDDAIRVAGGKFAILRSSFERVGKTGGDVLNVKAGGTGDMAYNFFIGNATNGLKASNKGGTLPQCNIRMYNNTIVSCGFRQTKTGRGGSINFEEGARGMAYNNLIVNCKFGVRVVNNPVADTANLFYGYNYYWADSLIAANQFYPTTYITRPQATDFPNPSTYLPTNYTLGSTYDGTNAVQKGNPLFTSYPLPVTGGFRLQDMNARGNFKFTLQPSSPCIGKGYTGFQPLQLIPVDPIYGVTDYSQPGVDIGCYQSNGKGNQHF